MSSLLDLLHRHGRNLHSFMVLEPGLSTWSAPGGEAAVAYAARGGHWIAAGGPLCAPDQTVEVARAFADAARASGRSAAFFGVSQRFLDRFSGAPDFDALLIGQAPLWKPSAWSESVRKAQKLRNRLKKAARGGVTVRLAPVAELADRAPLRIALAAIVAGWVEAHALPPMGFMVTVELFEHPDLRRYFVAEHAGEVVGFAVGVPIYGRNGWLVEDLVITRSAPPGTSELLVDAAMRRFADEGAEVVSLGMVALAGLEGAPARHPWLEALLRTSSRSFGWLYDFRGLYRFREKMMPAEWEPVYLVSSGRLSWWTLRAVLMAFAEGWLPAFGLRVLGRWLRRRVAS